MVVSILVAIAVLVLPVFLFAVVGSYMMRATGRSRFRQTRRNPDSIPLNFRPGGYDTDDARRYWQWLGEDGLAAERRFLIADMVFPLWYGGLMLGGMFAAWQWLERPVAPSWLCVPVVIAMVSDWVENTVHILQIRRFVSGRPLSSLSIRAAALATRTKLVFFWVAAAVMVALAVWLLVQTVASAAALRSAASNHATVRTL